MLASINPLGERARRTRWGRTMAWYLVASVSGGAVMGAAAGALGAGLRSLVHPSTTALAAAAVLVCLVGLAFDVPLHGLVLPTVHRQVNENWLARYRGWVYGTGFGFQLGLGVATIVTSATVYVTVLLAVLSGSVLGGVVIGATFGLVRALPLLSVGRVQDPASIRDVLRRGAAWANRAHVLALGCLATVAVGGSIALAVSA
jgi:sulfite exporter TauE/SafE